MFYSRPPLSVYRILMRNRPLASIHLSTPVRTIGYSLATVGYMRFRIERRVFYKLALMYVFTPLADLRDDAEQSPVARQDRGVSTDTQSHPVPAPSFVHCR